MTLIYIIVSFLSLGTVQVLNAAETVCKSNKRMWHDDKGQKCIASNGKPCHFPFKLHDFNKVTMLLWNVFDFI